MKRTQLYLDEEVARFLTAESRRRGTTISFLVREAVTATYGQRNPEPDRGAIIRRVAEAWVGRDDLPPTDKLVRELRHSTRTKSMEASLRAKVPPR